MAYKDPEGARAYRLAHKDKIRARNKVYRETHKKQRAAYNRAYRLEHKEERRKYNRIRHQRYVRRIKEDILSHYSGGKPVCIVCEESRLECLSIDHIDGGGSKHRKKLGLEGQKFYHWLRQQSYPEGYQVLCMNCQFVKRVRNKECTGGSNQRK